MIINYINGTGHGITFYSLDRKNKKNTWTDFHIVPTSQPIILPPSPKTKYIDIPGSDNQLDLTESLTNDVQYNNRDGKIEFYVDPKYDWTELYSNILNWFHGRRLLMFLDDEPFYYYSGRFEVSNWINGQSENKIELSYSVDAYKYEHISSTDEWLWDDFDFEHDIARDYKDIELNSKTNVIVYGSRKRVSPIFIIETIDEEITLYFKEKEYILSNGKNQIINLTLDENENTLLFYGNGKVSIEFIGGSL